MNAPLPFGEILLRILAATIAGALMGMERETHGRPAGLRTTILACVASALAMITSEFLFAAGAAATAGGNWRPDPARLGAGILTGIGFLGAGTILRNDNLVRGVTTAATLWFVTVLGLTFGAGLFAVGSLGTVVALLTLITLPRVERHLKSDWYSKIEVTMTLDAMSELELQDCLSALGAKVQRMDLKYDFATKQKTLTCDLKLDRRAELAIPPRVIASLGQKPGILKISWL